MTPAVNLGEQLFKHQQAVRASTDKPFKRQQTLNLRGKTSSTELMNL